MPKKSAPAKKPAKVVTKAIKKVPAAELRKKAQKKQVDKAKAGVTASAAKKAAPALEKKKSAKKDVEMKPPPLEKKKSGKKGQDSSAKGGKLLELGLLCDCTSSMWSWIDRAKKTLI